MIKYKVAKYLKEVTVLYNKLHSTNYAKKYETFLLPFAS